MMPGYRVVDLRGEIAPARSSWGNSSKGAGVIQHYNGGPVPVRAWNKPIQWIRFINDLHRQPGRFAPGWQINGIAYCEWVIGNTVYRLRDYAADLPHCGNLYYNRNAIGLHIPVGGSQRPQDAGKGTMLTAMRRADDHLRAMGLSRQHYKGHRQVGPSACPGDPIMEQIQRYWQGMDVQPAKGDSPKAANPPVQSAPSNTVWRGTRWEWCQDNNAPCPAILTYNNKDVWRVERVSSNPDKLQRMSRWEWCRANSAPTPVVLTYDGGSAWKVTRI